MSFIEDNFISQVEEPNIVKTYNELNLDFKTEKNDDIVSMEKNSIILQSMFSRTRKPSKLFSKISMLAQGSAGITYKAILDKLNVVIKKDILYELSDSETIIMTEAYISKKLNILRAFIPNFTYMYAVFKCGNLCKHTSRECNTICDAVEKKRYHLVYEYVNPGNSIIQETTIKRKELFLQVMGALQVAQATLNFTHSDLHGLNILVKKLDKKRTLYYPIYSEKGMKVLKITTDTIAMIIDYGTSSIYDGKRHVNSRVSYVGEDGKDIYDTSASSSGRDIYRLSRYLNIFLEFWKDKEPFQNKYERDNKYFTLSHKMIESALIPSDIVNWIFNDRSNLRGINAELINIDKIKTSNYNPLIDTKLSDTFNQYIYNNIINTYLSFPTHISGILTCLFLHKFANVVPSFKNRIASIINTINKIHKERYVKNVDIVNFIKKYMAMEHIDLEVSIVKYIKLYQQLYYSLAYMTHNPKYGNYKNRVNNVSSFYYFQSITGIIKRKLEKLQKQKYDIDNVKLQEIMANRFD